MDHPKLRRGLEAFPIQYQGQTMVLVRDHLGLSDKKLVFSPHAAQLLNHMDGRSSLRELQAYYGQLTGEILFMEDLEGIVHNLDEALFLENDRFIRAAAEEVATFQRSPVRRMVHAGQSYPGDPDEVRRMLDGFFVPENDGPGFPAAVPGNSANGPRVLGAVAPHIDLQGGGACYAYVYKAIVEGNAPGTWVVLGTGHDVVDNYFALTLKDFETPLGVVSCDGEFAQELMWRASRDILASEYNHRREHTIEFQALLLAHLQPAARIVPLLCSFGLEDWEIDRDYIDEFAGILWDLASQGERSVGFLASVDLAHVGPRYGDSFRPHTGTITEHGAADLELLEALVTCNAVGFMKKLRREKNRRRICGMAPLYVLARVLQGKAKGRLLRHAHAVVDPQGSFVTFAGMVFDEASRA